jgi:hypothetical protein
MPFARTIQPVAIDPPHCGCTECLTGEYVPLELATHEQVVLMLMGKIRDNTSVDFRICVRSEDFAKTWDVTDEAQLAPLD